jgi:peptidyl-prolyl cis-trans isomerase C
MMRWSMRASVLTGAALLAAASIALFAQAQEDRVVATVGSHKITVGDAQARLAHVPLFQLKNLGDSHDAVKLSFVEQLATLELLVQGARDAKLDERRDVRDRIRDKLRMALLNDLHREALDAREVSDAEVAAYYQLNKSRYAAQQRIKIWQIVVGTRAEAQDILNVIANDEAYAKDPAEGWDKLARERSLDKSTSMRKGDLGFVQPDGTTAHKDIVVPKELYEAAMTIKDGELLKEPVHAAKYWVVLQRRGSVLTPERKLETEAVAIRGVLAREKVEKRRTKLLDDLRTKYVKEKNPVVVDAIVIDQNGDIEPRERPGSLRRATRAARGRGAPTGPPEMLR